jgi:hypothetical protein
MDRRQHQKVDFVPGKIRFAEEQTAMDGDDRMASVCGYGCGGEGGGGGGFVSWLGAEIQPPKEVVQKIVMVEMVEIRDGREVMEKTMK